MNLNTVDKNKSFEEWEIEGKGVLVIWMMILDAAVNVAKKCTKVVSNKIARMIL